VKVKPSKLQVSHPVVLVGSGGEIRSGWMPMNSEPISVLRSVEVDKGMLTLTNNSTSGGRQCTDFVLSHDEEEEALVIEPLEIQMGKVLEDVEVNNCFPGSANELEYPD
jgi:hypothetical protein